jgi:hypothetical protein
MLDRATPLRIILISLLTVLMSGSARQVLPLAAEQASVSTLVGTGQRGYSGDGGPASHAEINNPYGIAIGPDGALYFCDTDNHVVRRVSRDGTIATVAGNGKSGYSGDGQKATEASMNEPYEVRFDRQGSLYIVERMNHVVRFVDSRTALIRTVAGNGKAKKPEVAIAVAHRFPSLRVYLTQDRRWKERHWQNMFDAIALALHHQTTQPPSRSRFSD